MASRLSSIITARPRASCTLGLVRASASKTIMTRRPLNLTCCQQGSGTVPFVLGTAMFHTPITPTAGSPRLASESTFLHPSEHQRVHVEGDGATRRRLVLGGGPILAPNRLVRLELVPLRLPVRG